MQINVESMFRSAVVLAIGLPITFGIGAVMKANLEKDPMTDMEMFKSDLSLPCLKFAVTKPDSKGEREAKDTIDEIAGDGVDYREVCKWVLG